MKFRKAVSVFAALAICSVLMPLTDMPVVNGTAIVAQAEETTEITIVASGTCGENVTWTRDSNGTLTISGEGAMYNYSNLESKNNYTPWWNDKTSITSVVIEKGVTTIGDWAFGHCSNLASVEIPDGITKIGSYAFFGDSSLTSVVVPEGVTWIGNEVFKSCSKLESISLPSTLTYLGTYQFQGCKNLNKVVIPDGCTVLTEDSSFPGNITVSYGGKCGENVIWEYADGVLTISGEGEMYNYGNSPNTPPYYDYINKITSVVIEDGVTTVGGGAFMRFGALKDVTIANTVTSIGGYAFYNTGIESLVIPEGVTSIGNYAFQLSSLKYLELPETLTTIGGNNVFDCDIVEVIVPSGNEVINKTLFRENTKLIYRTAWQFEKIDMNQWSNGTLYFDYKTDDVEGTSTTDGIIVSNFVNTYASDKANTILSGESTINFNIIVLEDVENTHFTRVYIKAPTAAEASEINLASGAFDPEAEIEDSEFIEIGDSEFDVE